MENIKISVSESGRDDNISIVRIDGVIDTLTATKLEEVLERLIKRQRYNIILDLAGVDYISSAGWGIFISQIREIRENKGDIKLANMIPNVYEIYELLEFDNVLFAYDNINGAKGAFTTPAGRENLKKKESIAGVRTTIEELPSIQGASDHLRNEPAKLVRTSVSADRLEESVLGAIKEDPFYTIMELKFTLEHSSPGNPKVRWWDIFKILRKNHLLSRRARFRYARQSWNRG
jgi:anti-sigma B factor antagonist